MESSNERHGDTIMGNYLYNLCDGVIHCEQVLIEDVAFTVRMDYDTCMSIIKTNKLPMFNYQKFMLATDAYTFFLKRIH